MSTTENDRAQTPDADHPVLELTYEVKSTHRLRFRIRDWADDFADWFEHYNDDETPLTAAQVHELLVGSRDLPEMLKDHLIEASADDRNVIGADMDDYDVRIAWVPPRGSS